MEPGDDTADTRGDRAVFLTFDDGPDPVWTPRVIAALAAACARATFFVETPRACRYPSLIARMLREGHAVEFHCTHHLRHTGLSLGAIREDTRTGLRGLRALGVSPRLWRPPWGVATPRTRKVAREHGLSLVGWSADTHDWRGDRARRMLDAVTQEMRPGAIVLMHDGIGPGARRTGCEETVALIPMLAQRARSLGCEPLPLGDSGAERTPA